MKNVLLSGAAALILAAGGAWWLANGSASNSSSGATDFLGAANAQENIEDVDTSSVVEMTLGDESAPVTIVEYASFTCPHCANFHKNQFKQLKSEYIDTGKVHFIYREVYFNYYDLWASLLARCGGEERFFGMVDLIYNKQREWIGDGEDRVAMSNELRKLGKVAGLDEATVNACFQDAEKASILAAWYGKNDKADDITSTPTLIINGEKHSNQSFEQLKSVIDGLLPG